MLVGAVASVAGRPALSTHFYQLGLQAKVVLSQLPLLATSIVAAGISGLIHPPSLFSPGIQWGLALQILLLIPCAVIPWRRLPRGSFLAIPVLDFISVALLREGVVPAMMGVGLLAVFPVVWLAGSNIAPRTAVAAGGVLTLATVWVPLFLNGTATFDDLARPFLVPLIMVGVGISAQVVTSSMEAQRTALEEKDQALTDALDASRRREQLLDAVVDTVGVGLLAVDDHGHDILMNRQQRKFHALAAPDGVPDPNETQLMIFEADRASVIEPEERPVRRAVLGETFADRLIWLGSGTDQRAVSVSAKPFRDDSGNFAGSVVTFSDVTDLVTALSMKDDFVSNISHELRTPLTSILGYLGLALDESPLLPVEVVQYLKVAERNAERLLDLVSDLLSIASHQMGIQPRRTDLAELILLSIDSAAPRAAENNVRIENLATEPLTAWLDGARIGQVLDNLLSNAIKYSPDGGTVSVRAWTGPGTVSFEVSDTGMGMDEAEQAQAFTKFFRSGAVRRTAIPGVGLGLLITKTIVESHGGSIELRSARGVGTTFTVTLPAGAPDGDGGAQPLQVPAGSDGGR